MSHLGTHIAIGAEFLVLFSSCSRSLALNRSWLISTTPNTTKFFLTIFKLIQQSNMVILSCLAKKNRNLNLRKKRFSLLLKVAFSILNFWVENWIVNWWRRVYVFCPNFYQLIDLYKNLNNWCEGHRKVSTYIIVKLSNSEQKRCVLLNYTFLILKEKKSHIFLDNIPQNRPLCCSAHTEIS